MKCDICGRQGAKLKQVSRTYGRSDNMVVIDNIPIVVCPNCGESYITATTLQEIERLKLHKKNVKAKHLASVIRYV